MHWKITFSKHVFKLPRYIRFKQPYLDCPMLPKHKIFIKKVISENMQTEDNIVHKFMNIITPEGIPKDKRIEDKVLK